MCWCALPYSFLLTVTVDSLGILQNSTWFYVERHLWSVCYFFPFPSALGSVFIWSKLPWLLYPVAAPWVCGHHGYTCLRALKPPHCSQDKERLHSETGWASLHRVAFIHQPLFSSAPGWPLPVPSCVQARNKQNMCLPKSCIRDSLLSNLPRRYFRKLAKAIVRFVFQNTSFIQSCNI